MSRSVTQPTRGITGTPGGGVPDTRLVVDEDMPRPLVPIAQEKVQQVGLVELRPEEPGVMAAEECAKEVANPEVIAVPAVALVVEHEGFGFISEAV
jgi:hypothetical protein